MLNGRWRNGPRRLASRWVVDGTGSGLPIVFTSPRILDNRRHLGYILSTAMGRDGSRRMGQVDDERGERVDYHNQMAAIIGDTSDANATAQELVLESVRKAILSGIMEPGARLRQEELAEVFGTSRIPVREALRALEYEGLVVSEPHRGFTVTALDADDVEEVYDLRILLESHAVRLALPLLTDDDLEELEGLFGEMQDAESPDAQLAARERFYLRLYSVTGRPRLVGLIMRLRQEVARVLRWATIQHSGAIHEQFFEAVRVG